VAASTVRWRFARGAVAALLGLGALFPLGYLAYSIAALERGREVGIEMAERYVLAPLGSAAIVGLVALAVLMVAGRGRERDPCRRRPRTPGVVPRSPHWWRQSC
jgi:hypothetical protein